MRSKSNSPPNGGPASPAGASGDYADDDDVEDVTDAQSHHAASVDDDGAATAGDGQLTLYDASVGGQLTVDGYAFGPAVHSVQRIQRGDYGAPEARHVLEALAHFLPHAATERGVLEFVQRFGEDVRGYVADTIGTAMHLTTAYAHRQIEGLGAEMTEAAQQQAVAIFGALHRDRRA
jgi:hypothetical protein